MWLRITPIPLAVAEFRWSHFKIVIRRVPGATAMVKLHAWARPRADDDAAALLAALLAVTRTLRTCVLL